MKVPVLDLKAQYKGIEKEIDSAIKGVCESGQFILGDEVVKFEEEVASYCKINYGIGVSSVAWSSIITGTDRLMHFLWDAYEDKEHQHHQDFLNHFHQIDEAIGEIKNKINIPENPVVSDVVGIIQGGV